MRIKWENVITLVLVILAIMQLITHLNNGISILTLIFEIITQIVAINIVRYSIKNNLLGDE